MGTRGPGPPVSASLDGFRVRNRRPQRPAGSRQEGSQPWQAVSGRDGRESYKAEGTGPWQVRGKRQKWAELGPGNPKDRAAQAQGAAHARGPVMGQPCEVQGQHWGLTKNRDDLKGH